MNYIELQGNLTADPIVKKTKNGKTLATFTLAVNRMYTNKVGERTKKTTFFRVVAWDMLAQAVAYLTKGQNVIVQGSSDIRNWQDEKEQWHTVNEVIASSVGVSVINLFRDFIKNADNEDTTPADNKEPEPTANETTNEKSDEEADRIWTRFSKRETEPTEQPLFDK